MISTIPSTFSFRCIIILTIWQFYSIRATGNSDDFFTPEQGKSAVEVRAVFINCEPDLMFDPSSDFETKRFQREELFKHGVLRNCNKKLAVTINLDSDIDNFSDDYIPIEHVFEGSINRKRVRLLNPYVMRLRREQPLQAYKLRKIDAVSGIVTNHERVSGGNNVSERLHSLSGDPTFSLRYGQENNYHSYFASLTEESDAYHRPYTNHYRKSNENAADLYTESSRQNKADNYKKPFNDNSPNKNPNRSNTHSNVKAWQHNFNSHDNRKCVPNKLNHKTGNKENDDKEMTKSDVNIEDKNRTNNEHDAERLTKESNPGILADNFDTTEKEFDLYEIGKPNLWNQIHIQLFEKIGTPDGKTVWNDLTKDPFTRAGRKTNELTIHLIVSGYRCPWTSETPRDELLDTADMLCILKGIRNECVSSISPEWIGGDVVIRYRPSEWIPKDEFSLPMDWTSLYLLTPVHCDNADVYDDSSADIKEDYIIVPVEDVVGLEDDKPLEKRGDNSSISSFTGFLRKNEQGPRRVEIRSSRALLSDASEKLRIESNGEDRYLTIPHRRPLHAQIDLEARADLNQLVRDGSSGRMTTVVADSTRQTRTILSLQATNTGLVASRFRAITRNCIPEIPSLIKNNEDKSVSFSAPVVIPPMHNKHFQLELPIELPCELINCSVALLNDENESVAVRDVTIKKGDRCFCVWHCDCTCLSDDPKLLCREMSEAHQAAAGLSTRNRLRHTRSVCYQDAISVNLFVIFTGVLVALLFLGFVKAVVGLFMPCIAAWGIDRIIQAPRKLNHYYESSLRSQEVQYDEAGWPVHPDTKKRTVRFLSRPMEFFLNLIFFVCAPCLIVCDAYKQLVARFNNCDATIYRKTSNDDTNTKKCFSSQDMQNLEPRLRRRRRRGALHKWMTTHAEELSTDIWQKGLDPKQSIECDFTRPLLQDESRRGDGKSGEIPDFYLDSEQDDTEYVLMQMQKSRESLARSQKRLSFSGLSSVKIHGET